MSNIRLRFLWNVVHWFTMRHAPNKVYPILLIEIIVPLSYNRDTNTVYKIEWFPILI